MSNFFMKEPRVYVEVDVIIQAHRRMQWVLWQLIEEYNRTSRMSPITKGINIVRIKQMVRMIETYECEVCNGDDDCLVDSRLVTMVNDALAEHGQTWKSIAEAE